MTRFWWVRHAPTHSRAMVGWSDIPADLSDVTLLERVSALLPDRALVVSSDLIRARGTADAIAGDRVRLPDERGLREFHFGEWELKLHSEIAERNPELLVAYLDSPGDVRAPGGETWNEVAARVSQVVDRLESEHSGADIIAVSHFGAILTQVQRGFGISAGEACSRRIDNLSVTRIVKRDVWKACSVNLMP